MSCVSSVGSLALVDAQGTLVASQQWSETEQTAHSDRLSDEVQNLLQEAGVSLGEISELVVVTGPGAFTGIRMTAAFAQGFVRGLQHRGHDVRLKSLPTYFLFQKTTAIPLRSQKCRSLTLPQALAQNLEFLILESETSFRVGIPTENSGVVGLLGSEAWPTIEQLVSGMAHADLQDGLHVNYGLEPKISGVRGA